jgi:lipid A 3-O-deacylase
MMSLGCFLSRFLSLLLASALSGNAKDLADVRAQDPPSPSSLSLPADDLIPSTPGMGDGFLKGTRRIALAVGHGSGPAIFGSTERHDLLLGTAQFGWMISQVVGQDHPYRGNWELGAEVMGGWQYHPRGAYLVGVMPTLRYHLATGTRWVPFAQAGAGILFTDIGEPDLATTFEFQLLAGAGLNYRITPHLALGIETRFAHISNAGIEHPNFGVNTFQVLTGLTWFF